MMKKKNNNNNGCIKKEQLECNYHVIHKLPPGDSPYVRAKYAQVISTSHFNSFNMQDIITKLKTYIQ